MSLTKEELEEIYETVDSIPFSKTKRNIHRDFSDGVMMSELLHYYFPKLVQLHNYPNANSVATKTINWETLNNKVLKKIGIPLKKKDIQAIVNCHPNAIELLLKQLFIRVGQPIGSGDINHGGRVNEVSLGDTGSFHHTGFNNRADSEEMEQIEMLQQKIQKTYMQLMKLNQISRLKDGVIRNLERKFDQLFYK